MPRKGSTITVTDQFCGAGGSSQGVRLVAREKKLNTGLEVKLAMNHWPLAIETHNTNFPEAEHACENISSSDPRRFGSTTILITSPECTVHSPAGGGHAKKKIYGNQLALSGKFAWEEAEDRSRATMFDVPRFAEYHRYEIIIVENVVEARKWELFDVWLMAMDKLGYNHQIKYFNSMHFHPTPQSRDRMYCVFWKKGNKAPDLEHQPIAPCVKCCKNVEAYQHWKNPTKTIGKYRIQYVFKCPDCHSIVEPYFYAAFNVIDWSRPGTRIGDRKRRLSPKTEERCQYGIDKYWNEPSFINVKYSSGVDFRVKSVSDDSLTTQPQNAAVGILKPAIISGRYISGIGSRVKSSHDALAPQMTEARESLFSPPLVIKNFGGNFEAKHAAKPADHELGAHTTADHHAIFQAPLIVNTSNTSNKTGKGLERSSLQVVNTQTTLQDKAVVVPPLITTGEYTGRIKPVTDEGFTQTTQESAGLLTPIITVGNGKSLPHSSEKEFGGMTTRERHGILTDKAFNSFLSYYYGGSNVASHITEAMRTASTKERAMLIEQPYEKPKLEDCYYRMLLPHEIQLGMAFDEDYIVLGDSKSKVKQLGNAVTPPVMKFLVERCVETLM